MKAILAAFVAVMLGRPSAVRAEDPTLISAKETPPKLLKQVYPSFGSVAVEEAHKQRRVRVYAIVAPDGSVSEVWVDSNTDAVHALDEPAMAAMKQWKFRPAMRGGEAVATMVWCDFDFALKK